MEKPKVQWLRKLDDPYVYGASELLLKRNDLYPCDVNGKFASESAQEASAAAEEAPGESEAEKEAAEAAETKAKKAAYDLRMIELRKRAVELGVKSAHNMKEETILDRIAAAEAALADKAKEEGSQSEGNTSEGNTSEGNSSE